MTDKTIAFSLLDLAPIPERIPVRHWLCWLSGYHLGGNCSGAVGPRIA